MQGKEPSHETSPSSPAKKPKISSTILDVTGKEQLESAQEALIKCYEEDLEEELLTCKMITLVVGNASSLLINSVVRGIAGAANNKQEYTILILPQEVLLTDDTMESISNAQLILQHSCDEKTPTDFDDELEIDLDDYELPPAQEILNNCYQNYFAQKLDFLVNTIFLTPCQGNEDELSAIAWGLIEALRGRDTPVKIIINSSLPAQVQGQLMYHLSEAHNTNPNPNCHIIIGYRAIPTLKDICLSYLATNNHLIPSDVENFPADIQYSFSKIVPPESS